MVCFLPLISLYSAMLITIVYLKPNFIQFSQTVLIQTIPFCISVVFVYTQTNIKTVLFQTIEFNISTQFSSIWPIVRVLSGATTPGQSESGSDGNKAVFHILQSSSISGASHLDSLVSYPGHSNGGVVPLCRDAVRVFYSTSCDTVLY